MKYLTAVNKHKPIRGKVVDIKVNVINLNLEEIRIYDTYHSRIYEVTEEELDDWTLTEVKEECHEDHN